MHCCDLSYARMLADGRVLHQTDNFFVTPTLGQMGIDGYLLILSKEHRIGVGDVPAGQHKELADVVAHTRSVLQATYDRPSVVFEHGPRVCNAHRDVRGGGCLDHAHLHVVPGVKIAGPLCVSVLDCLEETGNFFRVERTEGFNRVADIYHARTCSYMYVDDPATCKLVTEVNIHIPSQFLRRVVADQRGVDIWDWAVWPDEKTFERTLRQLQGKF